MRKVLVVVAVLTLQCLGITAQADVFNLGPGLTNLETVAVSDARNAADSTGYGSVSYSYNIGKYEVTAGQYCDFLNAKAKTDTYGLYNTDMVGIGSIGCMIQRSGISGSYTYSVAADYANRPVNYVSFWDACRFTNWLSNGQGNGDTETGAYTLTTSGMTNNTITRNAGWKWAVASEDEWYKAAYDKGGSTNAGYWLYPTRSNTAPGRDIADTSGNNANYRDLYANYYLIGSPYFRTEVGEFQNSISPYGTLDQGGNVQEWNEAIILGDYRSILGGSFDDPVGSQKSYKEALSYPTGEYVSVGFRVVQAVPEPSSLVALDALVAPLLMKRRSRKAKV